MNSNKMTIFPSYIQEECVATEKRFLETDEIKMYVRFATEKVMNYRALRDYKNLHDRA